MSYERLSTYQNFNAYEKDKTSLKTVGTDFTNTFTQYISMGYKIYKCKIDLNFLLGFKKTTPQLKSV